MIRLFLLKILFLGFAATVFGQDVKNAVYLKITSADSVIIVSHLTTYVPFMDEETDKRDVVYKLVDNNKPNYKIIKERYSLNTIEVDSLSKILTTKNTDTKIVSTECFMPHHGVLIFKKGKCSYFDICFGCRHFRTSADIKLSDELNDKTWTDLESFFRNRGLNYEMP